MKRLLRCGGVVAMVTASGPAGSFAQTAGVAAAEARLRAALLPEAGTAHRITITRSTLGCATVVSARLDPPSYPGTGTADVLVGPDQRLYGARGETDLAPLIRACGWLVRAPSPTEAATLLSSGWLDGNLASHAPAAVTLHAGSLQLRARAADPLSGRDREDLVLEAGATGPARFTRTPIVVAEPPTPPPAVLLSQAAAGRSTDAMALLAAIRSVANTRDPALRRSLAAITGVPGVNDAILGESINALGAGGDTGTLLRAAWSRVTGTRRTDLLDLAGGLLGADVRRAIESTR